MSERVSRNVFFQSLAVLEWMLYAFATCAADLSSFRNPLIAENLNLAAHHLVISASCDGCTIVSYPREEVKFPHCLLVQIFGVMFPRLGGQKG